VPVRKQIFHCNLYGCREIIPAAIFAFIEKET